MDSSRILAGLNAEQLAATTAPATPVVCIAGAGSGKTRVLTRRIAHRVATGEIDPMRIVVTTFTNSAATELSKRLFNIGFREPLMSGTFHALALKQIKQRSAEIGRSNPAIISSQYQFLKRNLPKEFDSHINSLLNEFGWASSQLIDAHSYTQLASAAHRKPSIDVTQVAELLEKYQQLILKWVDVLKLINEEVAMSPMDCSSVAVI